MKSIRLVLCLAALGVLLVIVGLAKGMSGGSSSSFGCPARGPGSAAQPAQIRACEASPAGTKQAMRSSHPACSH